jgi:hypothetical protein
MSRLFPDLIPCEVEGNLDNSTSIHTGLFSVMREIMKL